LIKAAGFPLNPLHIKTNLYNFEQLFELFCRYEVSISGSVDLPLSLHEKYRNDKAGRSTLARTRANLKHLADYPHNKKISCVVTREHMDHIDELIQDIRHIHYDIGLDMTRFNIMFAFDSQMNLDKFSGKIAGTEMLDGTEQVAFYRTIKQAFTGTDLEAGFRDHWFKEFTPEFCCSAVNCGDKFFLLQQNGDVYACPRGQSSRNFFYGNVFQMTIQEILDSGWQTIEALENKKAPNDECYACQYLPYCNQGCSFVREENGSTKSYTCKLQQEIYRDQADRYPPYDATYLAEYSEAYRFHNNVKALDPIELGKPSERYVTPELMEPQNALAQLIARDDTLKQVYAEDLFSVTIDGTSYALESPILNNISNLAVISPESQVRLCIKDHVFDLNCRDPLNNPLMIMILRNTMLTYGDEGRLKQEHLIDYAVYRGALEALAKAESHERVFDLTAFLQQHQSLFAAGVRNNLYVTTKTLREYHYSKQKKNAFYHIQAINLPFPFLEFYWQSA
jgi:uncharacterized protein